MELKHKNNSKLLILVLVLTIAVITSLVLIFSEDEGTSITLIPDSSQSAKQTPEIVPVTPEVTPAPIPSEVLLSVPFTPQAPTANWDELHNEACEEASSIMANAYFSKITSLPPNLVENEIDKLTQWQDSNFGYHLSITTEETAKMLKDVYDLNTTVTELSEEAMKRALSNGQLIIFPANGQLLKNPYFKQPGPIYHMLVITGFDKDGFITNDPGTKRGLNYRYNYDTLYNSNGNWSHADKKVNLTEKKIIIVSN